MSAILSQEENNPATTDLVENAGKQIVAVTGNVLGGAVYTHTENATAVSKVLRRGSDVNLINSNGGSRILLFFALRGKIDGIWIVSIKLRPDVGHDQ